MLRKYLALSLIASWIWLSGFDVWEDLHPYSDWELHSATNPADLPTVPSGRLVNNIVETANNCRLGCSASTEESAPPLTVAVPDLPHKTSRLHLLHRVLLI